jgi:pimeloyl-ACP methyl ester carboxylesterase
MPRAHANAIELEYETFGNAASPHLLLIMGLGMQMIAWPDDFCQLLSERGFHVIRFDNRDVGLSTMIEGGPAPNVFAALAGDTSSASYTLDDMADDAVGLMEALDIAAAHVVGASMGGMIAQVVAIRHPQRVVTLTSIMSTTGDPGVGQPTPEAMTLLLEPPAADRERAVDRGAKIFGVIGSRGALSDEARVRDVAGRSWDRNPSSDGLPRQLVAVIAAGDRTEQLRSLSVATLVIHGEDDPLVAPSGGAATAAAIAGARLLTFPGMGHDLPEPLWPRFVDAIAELASKASTPV